MAIITLRILSSVGDRWRPLGHFGAYVQRLPTERRRELFFFDGTDLRITEKQNISYSFDAHIETTRSPQRSYSKQLSLLTFSLRSILNCSKYCSQSIHKHTLCRTIQLPDHPPRFCNPRLKKLTQIVYRHNLIQFLPFIKNEKFNVTNI